MSYQVLARKWRPHRFSELVGQEHVIRALTHGLDGGRIHHAFLFTGTRGVGKTTIARILAKSLNCDKGPTSEPCGQCSACIDIDAGRFVDLLEIDAASRTKVDDTRELLDNVIYAPSRGRYKVYLIDEVHMLSTHSFNALLKTLEEPPPHVKFLLATTDPQKLPVTVLSRCIKFNLKRLTLQQIAGQMRYILNAENVSFEDEAIIALARAADGSMRDGLSLIDQAIAHGGGSLRASEVHAMLGTVERGKVQILLEALAAGDGAALFKEVDRIAEFSPDFCQILDELAELLHRLQLQQLIPQSETESDLDEGVKALVDHLPAQEVQLFYQMAITGRRDLPLAPTPRVGFEMTLLRMLAFSPAAVQEKTQPSGLAPISATVSKSRNDYAAIKTSAPITPPTNEAVIKYPQAPPSTIHPEAEKKVEMQTAAVNYIDETDWAALIERAELRGPVGQLAQQTALLGIEEALIRLALKSAHEHLATAPLIGQLERCLSQTLGREIKVRFEKNTAVTESPADQRARQILARQQTAEKSLRSDPVVQSLIETFDARIIPNSVRSLES